MARNSAAAALPGAERAGAGNTEPALESGGRLGRRARRRTAAGRVGHRDALTLADARNHFHVHVARFAELPLPRLHAGAPDDVADGEALAIEDGVDRHEQHARAIAEHDVGARGHLRPELGPRLVELDDEIEPLLVERMIG